jgi:hypothetical protein
MSALPLFLCLCLQPVPFGPGRTDLLPTAAKVSVLEVFSDGTLLVTIGNDSHAEKGDEFFVTRGTQIIAFAEITSLGKSHSVARVKMAMRNAQVAIGDRADGPTWESRRTNSLPEGKILRGGAIIDSRPDK